MRLKDTSLLRSLAYIDGHWQGAVSGKRFAVTNPADGTILAELPHMGAVETKVAIEAAHAAWAGWKARPAKERSQILRKWFDLIMAHQDDLALILTAEQGKPLAESMGEIAYGASFVEWFAEEAKRVYGDIIPTNHTDRRLLVLKEPRLRPGTFLVR
jgi:succinate-semialdehyde dehydrogenase / glutarate-semialdehyde dehydrogenase